MQAPCEPLAAAAVSRPAAPAADRTPRYAVKQPKNLWPNSEHLRGETEGGSLAQGEPHAFPGNSSCRLML